MIVREATAADWPAIWSFMHGIVAAGDTFSYDEQMDEQEAFQTWFLPAPAGVFVAADDEGAVVGTSNVHPNHAGPGAHVASGNFMVEPAHQGTGIGRLLCEHAVQWARDQGYRAMQFNAVAESNVRAVALYRSLGFGVRLPAPVRAIYADRSA